MVKLPVERLVSAGGVVSRRNDGGLEVILCGRVSPPLWALPKGTPNPGESLSAVAAREVREETGLEVEILGKIGSIRYWFVRIQNKVRCLKTVHHYLMAPIGGDLSQHDHEFDLVQWFSAEEACRIMTYPNEVDMVRQAVEMVEGKRKFRQVRRSKP